MGDVDEQQAAPAVSAAKQSLRQAYESASPERQALMRAQLGDNGMAAMMRGEWWTMARAEQLHPAGPWFIWLVLAGRGFGKSRCGAEWLISRVLDYPKNEAGAPTEWAAIGESLPDVRDVMIEGESGLLPTLDRLGVGYRFRRSPQLRIDLDTGQRIFCRSADDADVGRGWNLAGGWFDELAKWPTPERSWAEGLAPALRSRLPGDHPRVIVTTTPKRVKLLREWEKRHTSGDGAITITRGSTFDNFANLSAEAIRELRERYEGTRLGRQELYGELLSDVEGALWMQSDIDAHRVARLPKMVFTVVAIDPATTKSETSDETGLIVAGLGSDGMEYVIADLSGKFVGTEAATLAWRAFLDYGAQELIVEENAGKAWIAETFGNVWRQMGAIGEAPHGPPPLRLEHAKIGKRLRAEPVAARYEQGRVAHVGRLVELEDQMTTWEPDGRRSGSPDRIDALVHALTRLYRRYGYGGQAIATSAHISRDDVLNGSVLPGGRNLSASLGLSRTDSTFTQGQILR